MRRRGGAVIAAWTLGAALASAQSAPPPPPPTAVLSLEDALVRARDTSEQIDIARAGVRRAEAGKTSALSEWLPQLNASTSYVRTLKSQFNSISASSPSSSSGTTGDGSGGGDASTSVPNIAKFFASPNTWRVGATFSENLFSGFHTVARQEAARAGLRTADLSLASARAATVLDAAQAYYDAALGDRLVALAEATLQQAEQTLHDVKLAHDVGNRPEFDLLRAQVDVENQRPVVVQQRIQRDLAYLRLKQLLEVPLNQPLRLSTDLDGASGPEVALVATRVAGVPPEAGTLERVPLRVAHESVTIRESSLRIAKSQHYPRVDVTSSYGLVNYSNSPWGAGGTRSWFTDWNVGISLSVPLFTGLRIHSDVLAAQAELEDALAREKQTDELSRLDSESAREQLAAAIAAWEASAAAVELAQRALEIAQVRYTEGISTQLELSDARLQRQQAGVNRARAARDLQLARIRVALLPYLPLTQSTAPTAAASVGAAASGGGATQIPLTPAAPPVSIGSGSTAVFGSGSTIGGGTP